MVIRNSYLCGIETERLINFNAYLGCFSFSSPLSARESWAQCSFLKHEIISLLFVLQCRWKKKIIAFPPLNPHAHRTQSEAEKRESDAKDKNGKDTNT